MCLVLCVHAAHISIIDDATHIAEDFWEMGFGLGVELEFDLLGIPLGLGGHVLLKGELWETSNHTARSGLELGGTLLFPNLAVDLLTPRQSPPLPVYRGMR